MWHIDLMEAMICDSRVAISTNINSSIDLEQMDHRNNVIEKIKKYTFYKPSSSFL
jgi:hypothetical protein